MHAQLATLIILNDAALRRLDEKNLQPTICMIAIKLHINSLLLLLAL